MYLFTAVEMTYVLLVEGLEVELVMLEFPYMTFPITFTALIVSHIKTHTINRQLLMSIA